MIHQLKRIEPNPTSTAKYKLSGISIDHQEEWLWTASIQKRGVQFIFVSKRPRMFMNGTEVEWRSQHTVPEEIENHVAGLAKQVGDLFKTVEVS